ncbi:flavoprotein-domain-containing protein [Chaetomium strumarium]|uniref:Flavoprotein-domain-containing protein n=1 Tax=Chaetomium strumarium TaxID=1170767 RepID=A0AAJ0GXI7_9PEZI|nr:flavoprotein-domain-containing protein [Chaetomium strumarium]
MLHPISSEHDTHYEHSQSNSIEALVAARNDGKKHLLLAYAPDFRIVHLPDTRKLFPVIVEALAKYEGTLSIRIILTESATHFLGGQSAEQPTVSSLLHLPNVEAVYRDHDEWGPQPWRRGASILHIELRRWADLLVVAPLSANTLAKVVNGMSDNLLTSVIRAWDTDASIDMKKKIIIVAPAMNSAMWRNPITEKQIRVLTDEWGVKEEEHAAGRVRSITGWFQIIMPVSKTLACGDTGGAMAAVPDICAAIEQKLNLTAAGEPGPTHTG